VPRPRGLQTGVAGFNDLAGSPDQDIRVPDRRHAVLRHGFDANGDLAGTKVDRNGTLRFSKREEWISHKILRVTRRKIAGKRTKQIKLLAF
jgi:hypothetical protein